jgi:hypothetical protein
MGKINIIYVLTLILMSFLFSTCESNNDITCPCGLVKHYALVLQPDSSKGKDALITLYTPNANFGNHISMHPDCWTIGGDLDIIRGLIQFDLSSIPGDAAIDSAFISFYYALDPQYNGTDHYGNNYMLLQRITEPWQENTVTWNNQPNVDSNYAVWINKFVNPHQDYNNIDVTHLVRDIFKSNKNYGFMLRMSDETPFKITLIASSDYPDSTKHPKLVVYYSK